MKIQDSIVFIAGANRSLGLAFAKEALERGARKVYAGVHDPTNTYTPGIVQVKLDITDAASIAAAAIFCRDTTLLVNNASTSRLNDSGLDALITDLIQEIVETSYYGTILVSRAFAPILAANGGGAVVNVLSDATWFARPVLAANSAAQPAVWGFTNALLVDRHGQDTCVLDLHADVMAGGMSNGFDIRRTSSRQIAQAALTGIETSAEKGPAGKFAGRFRQNPSCEQALSEYA